MMEFGDTVAINIQQVAIFFREGPASTVMGIGVY